MTPMDASLRLRFGAWWTRWAAWHPRDPWSAAWLTLGFAALAGPTLWRLAHAIWPTEEQGHGPLVLLVSCFLLLKRAPDALRQAQPPTAFEMRWAGLLVGLGLLVYVIGRSQAILMAQVGSLIVLLGGLLLLSLGGRGLRPLAFPLLFLLFMIPLPEVLVATVTAPMKSAVSTVAASILQDAGMPVARSGVMLTAGPYQLLVADACAGLTTLFTLEAVGLLYLHLRGHAAWWRNAALAVMVIPIAFAANVLRVITLVLVTLWWGDAVGQGYAHHLAGLTLFVAAVFLLVLTDQILGALHWAWQGLRGRMDGPVRDVLRP